MPSTWQGVQFTGSAAVLASGISASIEDYCGKKRKRRKWPKCFTPVHDVSAQESAPHLFPGQTTLFLMTAFGGAGGTCREVTVGLGS